MRLSIQFLSGLCCLSAYAVELDLEFFNSPQNDVSITFSADASEAWLERRSGEWGASGNSSYLLYTQRDAGGGWQPLVPVPFAADGFNEGDPFFDDAAQTLYFTSDRAHPDLPEGDVNIWRVTRSSQGWGTPEALPAVINQAGMEFSPVRRGQHLYFAAWRDGDGELYIAEELQGGGWQSSKLGAAVNSPTGEWNLWVSPDEQLMLFEASGRSTNVSVSGDVYLSSKDRAGHWLPAMAVSEINGTGSDLNAQIIGDQLIYVSTSEHQKHSDLYIEPVEAIIERSRSVHAHTLQVVNRSSHELVSVNLQQGEITARHAVGPGPHLLAAGAGKLATAAYGIYPRPHNQPVEQMPGWVQADGGQLLVVSGESIMRQQLRCNRPHGAVWDDSGSRLWVSCEDRLGVVEVEFSGAQPAYRFLPTGRSGGHVLAWDSVRRQLLIAHTAAGGVAIMNPVTGNSEFTTLGPGSEALWINAERDEVWVTIGQAGQLAVVDLNSGDEVRRLDPDCGFPIDFAQSADGVLWVTCFWSSEVLGIDMESYAVIDRLDLPYGALNIAAHPSLPVLYGSMTRRNAVFEISLTGRGITRQFGTGMEPDGLAVLPAE